MRAIAIQRSGRPIGGTTVPSALRSRIRASRRPGGFTLAEVLIALGILAIGLAMAASLLPAALKINEGASKHVLGAIICQNGLAVAKAKLTTAIVPPSPNLLVDLNVDLGLIPAEDMAYPSLPVPEAPDDPLTEQGDAQRGWFVLAHYMGTGGPEVDNDYLLLVIAYQRSILITADMDPVPPPVELVPVPGTTIIGDIIEFTDPDRKVQPRTVVVAIEGPLAGQHAFLVEYDAATRKGKLDRALGSGIDVEVFVLYEKGAQISPTLTAMTARTALRDG